MSGSVSCRQEKASTRLGLESNQETEGSKDTHLGSRLLARIPREDRRQTIKTSGRQETNTGRSGESSRAGTSISSTWEWRGVASCLEEQASFETAEMIKTGHARQPDRGKGLLNPLQGSLATYGSPSLTFYERASANDRRTWALIASTLASCTPSPRTKTLCFFLLIPGRQRGSRSLNLRVINGLKDHSVGR